MRKKLRLQRSASVGAASVAVVLTGLSLSHLSHGIHIVTQASAVECWAMAIGIDMGFLAAEAAMLCGSTEAVRKKVWRYAGPAIGGTLSMSSALNALAFVSQALPILPYQVSAAGLGVSIPALIYALVRIAFVLWTAGGSPEQ
ncbi:hypothetical protein V5F77_04280 [Xanthobacter sp. DSM 24535]|uniref:hypothetical protein n=1 Tax=Roseixanthobacter psychrophilus TaxID=3119917 RepID=UPI003727BB60